LELLLQRLASYPAIILDAAVSSTVAQQLPIPERHIDVDGYPYPIDSRLLNDTRQFRVSFGSAQARVGREPGATGPGNATKRIRVVLDFPEGTVPGATELENWLCGPSATGIGYWALLANPDVYRIADAVTSFETDSWTTKGARLATGDRVII